MPEFEKDVPLPERINRNDKYGFRRMKVGDSFFVEGDQENCRKVRQSIKSAQRRKCGRFNYRVYLSGDKDENGNPATPGIRVWKKSD